MASIDDLLAKAQPRQATVRVCLRGDLLSEHDRLDADLRRRQQNGDDDQALLDLADQIAAVEADIVEASAEFVLTNIGRARWTQLCAEHPSTEEQRNELGRRVAQNPETFPYAAIAACCVAPEGMTPDNVRDLEDVVDVRTWSELWMTTLDLNVGGSAQGESEAASAVRRRLRPSSEQPAPTASDAASSSDGP